MFLAKTRSWEIPLFIAYMLLLFAANVVSDFVVWPIIHGLNDLLSLVD